MTQYLTIARPYAVAVFTAAKSEPSLLKAWGEALQALAVCAEEPAMLQLIANPKITASRLLQMLTDILKNFVPAAVTTLKEQVENLLQLLIANKRLPALPDILRLYQELVASLQKIQHVEVCSAFELNEELRQELQRTLSVRFNSQLDIDYRVDPELIGGAVIRTKELVMDASIKGKLARLYHNLTNQG